MRTHLDAYNEFRADYKKEKDKLKNNLFKRKSSSSKNNMTEFAIISITMQLAVNLALYIGTPFSTLSDENMYQLTILECKLQSAVKRFAVG